MSGLLRERYVMAKRKKRSGMAGLLASVASMKRTATGKKWTILHRVESMLATAAGKKAARKDAPKKKKSKTKKS